LQQIAISAKQHDNGEGIPAQETFARLEAKLGLTSEDI